MTHGIPPLTAIRCFEAAARHLSFSRAAEELGMTQAAVSYQIKVLEDRVGEPLFLRGARGVTLTDSGRRIAPLIGEAFQQLRAAFALLADDTNAILKLTTLTTFAANWLVPKLGGFQLRHPEIAVRLDASNRVVDFAREDFDVGLRSGRGRWPGLVAEELFPAAFTPMMSPALLRQAGTLAVPADLLKLPLIDPADPWWTDWFAEAGINAPDLSGRAGIGVDNQQLAGRAALAGHGVAILMPAFFREELASGQLVQPFPIVKRSGEEPYWLVYPEARRRSHKVRAFRDWILAEVGKET